MVKRRRKEPFDDFFRRFLGDFDLPEGEKFMGYSIEVHSTPEGTKVHAKVHGDVNVEEFKKRLERMYPGAEIVIETPEGAYRGEEKSEIIVEGRERIKEEKITETTPEQPSEGVRISFKKGKPTIIEPEKKSSEIIVEKREVEEEKPREEKEKAVRITFRKGKPVIEELR